MNRLLFAICFGSAILVGQFASAEGIYSDRVSSMSPLSTPDESYCKKPYPNCISTHNLPYLCLQSVYGAGDDPANRRPSGAFAVKGIVSGNSAFTWNGNCYTAQMRYAGQDQDYWYYRALCTPYCFAIEKELDPAFEDHRMLILDCHIGGGYQFYQFAAPYDCPKPTTHHRCYYPAPYCSKPCHYIVNRCWMN